MPENNHEHKKCREMFAILTDYIDGELDTLMCDEIEAHAKTCRPCHVCLETLKRTVDLCGHTQSRPVPVHLSRKLKELIRSAG